MPSPSAAGPGRVRLFSGLFLLSALPFLWQLAANVAVKLRFEDSLIVLRYARNLVEGNGFVFNPDERVLGVTTPLQTLLAALVLRLAPASAPAAVNVLGVVFLALESLMAALLVRRFCGNAAAVLAGLLILLNLNFNYLFFGMEVHLFAFLVLLSLWFFLEEREVAAGVTLAVAFLTRYDAALLALLVALGLAWSRRRAPWRLVGIFAAVSGPWLVFSKLYFGSILPNTLAAKQGYFAAVPYLHRVLVYYKRTLEALVACFSDSATLQDKLAWFLPLFVIVGAVTLVARDRRTLLLVVYPPLHLLVYAVIGADPGFVWHFYLINPLLFLLLAVGVWQVLRWCVKQVVARLSIPGRRTEAVAVILGIAALVLPLALELHRTVGTGYELDPHTRDLLRMAEWLDERYGPETSLFHPSIGVIGYETDLRIVDQAGLVTPGLYYFDSERFTPIAEVMERHDPDLILVLAGAHPEIPDHGYRVLKEFHGHNRYTLYARSRDRS